MRSSLLLLGALLWGALPSHAQGYHVYHAIGPAMFTNSTSSGYANGQLAGADYRCGVYAGTDLNSLQPVFQQNPLTLSALFSSSGTAILAGSFTVPGATGVSVQFRAWPAIYATYEDAIANQPSVPVGTTGVYAAIPVSIIIEFPIQTGPMWLEPIPEPSPCASWGMGMLLGAAGAAIRRRRRSAS